MKNKLLFIRPELMWFSKVGTRQAVVLSQSFRSFCFPMNFH